LALQLAHAYDILKGRADVIFNSPSRFVGHAARVVYNPAHIRQAAVKVVDSALQVIYQNRTRAIVSLLHVSGVLKFLLDGAMCKMRREHIRVRLSRVDEQEVGLIREIP